MLPKKLKKINLKIKLICFLCIRNKMLKFVKKKT